MKKKNDIVQRFTDTKFYSPRDLVPADGFSNEVVAAHKEFVNERKIKEI